MRKAATDSDMLCHNRHNTKNKIGGLVSIVHTDPKLQVSEQLAVEIGKEDLGNLVRNRKLVLLVDLDHTLIHTTNEIVDNNLKVTISSHKLC